LQIGEPAAPLNFTQTRQAAKVKEPQIFFTRDGRKTTFRGLLIEKRLIGRSKEHASKS
jgi:hypothetical protein